MFCTRGEAPGPEAPPPRSRHREERTTVCSPADPREAVRRANVIAVDSRVIRNMRDIVAPLPGGLDEGVGGDSYANRPREKPSMANVLSATHDPDY